MRVGVFTVNTIKIKYVTLGLNELLATNWANESAKTLQVDINRNPPIPSNNATF
jgi:hypothetical protein